MTPQRRGFHERRHCTPDRAPRVVRTPRARPCVRGLRHGPERVRAGGAVLERGPAAQQLPVLWIVDIYGLFVAGLLITMGTLRDLRLFRVPAVTAIGLAIFCVALLRHVRTGS